MFIWLVKLHERDYQMSNKSTHVTMYGKITDTEILEIISVLNILRASLVAQRLKRLPTMRETWFNPWVGKIPWRRKWQPTPVFLPGESHGQRSLVGYSSRGRKESDTNERLHSLHSLSM